MKKTLFILILAGLSTLGYSQLNGGFVQVGGGSLTPQNLSTEGQASINFNNIFGFPDSLQIAAWAHETTSRTIYVATTGNDETGTGAVGAPYATVGKALSTINKVIDAGVTVTVSIGAGTFTLSAADLTVLSSISGAGTLTIQGTLTLVESGFTMGAADANDPLTYAVSGGNTASWTTNQWKFFFLKSSTNYYPITANSLTPKLSITRDITTGTEIYESQTIINISYSAAITFRYNCALTLRRLKLNFSAFLFTISATKLLLTFSECNLESTSNITFNNLTTLIRSSINGIQVNLSENVNTITNCYFYRNSGATNRNIFFVGQGVIISAILTNVFENPLGTCIFLGSSQFIVNPVNASYIKFVNSLYAFSNGTGVAVFRSPENIILLNTNYLIFKESSAVDYEMFKFYTSFTQILGAPVIRWFYNPMYEFINPVSGRSIQITGLIYPELEQNLTATLSDNATTNVIIGNKLQNRSIVLNYTIKRGTTYEVGRIKVLNDGTNLTIQEDTPLGDVGVTFTVDYNTNEIRLNCALTSTGTGATIYYNAQRVMITPLTL